MTNQELEQAILDIIQQVYCADYNGRLILTRKPDCTGQYSYGLTLGLNNIDKPLRLAFQGNDGSFLRYIEKEIKSKSLNTVSYYMGYQIVPEHGEDCEKQG